MACTEPRATGFRSRLDALSTFNASTGEKTPWCPLQLLVALGKLRPDAVLAPGGNSQTGTSDPSAAMKHLEPSPLASGTLINHWPLVFVMRI